jgi:cellulose synthase/poly-beta-1,6-N-acetylglucosamine synthase-like glycosyltransferase
MNGKIIINEKNSIGRPTISIMIPCHNEEKTIARCVESCLAQSRPAEMILVVDDGSTDNSAKILESFDSRIKLVRLAHNTGNKSYVQQIGLNYINTDIFISTDADTMLDYRFVECVDQAFTDPNICAAAGYVMSTRHNWLTALREIEYFVGQEVHKTAQSNINFLYVIPGCASAFRTAIFKEHITFDHDTVTEDLDFTFKLHRQNYRINFLKKAIVWTQDPADLHSYMAQVRRWYGGGWQNLLKHGRVAAAIPACAFELSLCNIEGMLFATSLVVLPIINIEAFTFMLQTYLAMMVLLGGCAAMSRRRADLVFYSPLYVFLAILNSYIYCETFFKEVLKREHDLKWVTPKRRA